MSQKTMLKQLVICLWLIWFHIISCVHKINPIEVQKRTKKHFSAKKYIGFQMFYRIRLFTLIKMFGWNKK